MKENNIAIVLDAVGEKIAALELALQCEQYKNTELEKQIVEREKDIAQFAALIAGKDETIKELESAIAQLGGKHLGCVNVLVEGR